MKEKTLIYDLEVYPNFFYALFYDINTHEYKAYGLSDKLLNEIILNPNVTLIGFNNKFYDDLILNFIRLKSLAPPVVNDGWNKQVTPIEAPGLNEKAIYDLSKQIIENKQDSIGIIPALITNLTYAVKAYDSIDLKSLLDPIPGLKKMELRMHFHNIQELPYNPHSILTKKQKEEIRIYCINDVDATYELYKKHSLKHIELRQHLAQHFEFDLDRLQSASEPKTAEYILSELAARAELKTPWQIKNELLPVTNVHLKDCIPDWIRFHSLPLQNLHSNLLSTTLPINPITGYAIAITAKHTITLDDKNYQFGLGGLHSNDESHSYVSGQNHTLLEADVISYYPSILLRDDLYPRGYSKAWIDLYRLIYNERLTEKEKDPKSKATHALKIILNATFGKLGSKFSSFYDPTLLLRITITGQLALLMLIEKCLYEGIKVLSANTDGILINQTTENAEAFKKICKEWQQHTGMNLEFTSYRKYCQRDVNNYTALTFNNKIKNKGIFLPPDIKHDVKAPIIQKVARQVLLYNENLDKALNDAVLDATLYDFCFHFSATKAYKVHAVEMNSEHKEIVTHTTQLQQSNRWYIAKKSKQRIMKVGGKLKNWVSIPDGKNIKLANKINPEAPLPSDLDLDYYKGKIETLINSARMKL